MAQAATAVATLPARPSLVSKFASKYSIEPEKLMPILKATAFKVKDGEATNEQMAALLVVADQYGLNPFCKEIFAFPDKQNGIVPVVGVDGWSRIINDHPQFDGMEFAQSPEMVTLEGAQPCPEWMEVMIHRKDRAHPVVVREYLDEVYRPVRTYQDGNKGKPGPWQSHTKRFLRHKTLIQGARIAFGFGGIYDEDEAHRIIEMGAVVEVEKRTATMPREIAQVAPTPAAANADVTDAVPAEPASAGEAPAQVEGVPLINKTQIRILKKKLTNPEIEGWFCKDFGVATVEELPAAKINEALSWSPKGAE